MLLMLIMCRYAVAPGPGGALDSAAILLMKCFVTAGGSAICTFTDCTKRPLTYGTPTAYLNSISTPKAKTVSKRKAKSARQNGPRTSTYPASGVHR